MLPTNVYNDRMSECRACEWFVPNMCLKGHAFTSTTGCPVRKFPPINGAGYDPDKPPIELESAMSCCGYSRTMHDMTWAQVAAELAKAMVAWARAGLPLASTQVHGDRQSKCGPCPHRKGYWCGLCKCLILLKTKLATSQCPDSPPRWLAR